MGSLDIYLSQRHFHPQVPAGHHDAVGCVGNFVQIVQGFRGLDFGDNLGDRVVFGPEFCVARLSRFDEFEV